MTNDNEDFFPGTRVIVFDPLLYVDDVKTPLNVTRKPATVVCWHGTYNKDPIWIYENQIDVRFDHRPERVSNGHFVECVLKIKE